ncbi:MAG: protein DA1 [Melioribacteraceae bacterium]|nr:protein DA1 [Melioribacteraceae bacterium]
MKITKHIIIISFLLNVLLIAQTAICAHCGKEIKGTYIVIEGEKYHPRHFLCAKCRKPIEGDYYKNGDFFYDKKCYHDQFTDKCDVCQKPLIGKYVIDMYGKKYHQSHEKEYKKCDNCYRLMTMSLTGGGLTYSDGRNICRKCSQSFLSSTDQYRSLFNKIIRKLNGYGLKINSKKIEIYPVDRNGLRSAAKGSYSNSLRGYTETRLRETTRGNRTDKSFEHTVYILNNTPRKYVEATLAHELTHVWINENVENKLSRKREEGSCNFVAYYYLKSDMSSDADDLRTQIMNDPSVEYGDGFREVYKQFKNKNLSDLMRFLKK